MRDPKADPGQRCSSCGAPANRQCSCRCGAAYCYRCKKEGRIG